MANILIVEDEPAIAELVTFVTRGAGWTSQHVTTTAQAWDSLHQEAPQLVLLDWMLPDKSGLSLLSRIREDRQLRKIPVIMLTARGMEEDKIAGLDHGADDYVTKPFSPRELAARIKALLRRKSPEHALEVLRTGDIVLDPGCVSVTVEGNKVEIGHTEYKLLKFLMAYPGRVFSRSQLLDKVWGDHVVIEERTVDVHVLRLRKALQSAGAMVQTVRGAGYMLSEQQ